LDNNSLSREQQEAIRRIREREVRRGGIIERKSVKMTKQPSPPTRKRFPFFWLILICILGVIIIILYNFFNGSILNQSKIITWEKTFGGSSIDWASSLIQTTDGGYAVAGYTLSYGAGSSDFWIIKLDEMGNLR